MKKVVQDYIEKKNQEYLAKKQREKEEYLKEKNVFAKVYAPQQDKYNYEETMKFPYVESKDGVERRYKLEPADISDEEYEAMKEADKLLEKENQDEGERSGLSMAFVTLAVVIYITTFVLGIVFGNQPVGDSYSSHTEFNIGIAVIYWISGACSGTLMLGFASIVEHLKRQTELLTDILNKQ